MCSRSNSIYYMSKHVQKSKTTAKKKKKLHRTTFGLQKNLTTSGQMQWLEEATLPYQMCDHSLSQRANSSVTEHIPSLRGTSC